MSPERTRRENENRDSRVWPALGWASNTTTDASSLFTVLGKWASALWPFSSSNISSKSSGVLSELLRTNDDDDNNNGIKKAKNRDGRCYY